MNDSNIPSF